MIYSLTACFNFHMGKVSELWCKTIENNIFFSVVFKSRPMFRHQKLRKQTSRQAFQLQKKPNNSHVFNVSNFSVVFKKRTHGRAEIWNFSSSVQLDISRVGAVNDYDIELDNSCLGTEKDSFNPAKYCLCRWHQINSFAKLLKFMGTPELL